MLYYELQEGRLVSGGESLLLLKEGELAGVAGIPTAVHEWVETDGRQLPACKAYFAGDWLYGSIAVPSKETPESGKTSFYFLLNRERLILLERQGLPVPCFEKLMGQRHRYSSLEDLLLTLLEKLMYDDFFFVCGMEDALGRLEEQVMDGAEKGMNQALGQYRRQLVLFHSYYGQLVAVGERMEDEAFFAETAQLHAFLDKARRLEAKTESLIDSCTHIRDSLQAETGMRMNRTMQTLTVITALFMPVSVVSAWYGMNFQNMPELNAPGGYLITVAATAVLTLSAIIFCKIKKLF